MHFVYIDESGDEELIVYSALAIEDAAWRHAKDRLAGMRKILMEGWGIPPSKELHAWKFVRGSGRFRRTLTKGERADVFRRVLRFTAQQLGPVRLFNAVFPRDQDDRAFERLLNRVNRTMRAMKSRAILVCDEGKQNQITRMVRRMGVYNPIPSRLGRWPSGAASENIPTELILEDPFFRDSKVSNFIQVVDFCAFALLRRERPTAQHRKRGIHLAFAELEPILVREASRADPEGIIRPTKA